MAIYDCDIELRDTVDRLYGTPDNEAEYSKFVRNTIWPFVFNETAVGRTIKESCAYTAAFEARLANEMYRRFGKLGEIKGGVNYPGVYFAYRIEEVLADFLAAKIPEMEPLEEAEALVAHVQTTDERFAALVAEAQADIANPTISTVQINAKKENLQYRKAFEYVLAQSTAAGFGKTLTPAAKPEAPAKVEKFAHMLNDEIQTRGVPRPAAGFYTLHAGGKEYKFSISEFQRLSDEAVKFELVS